MKNNFVFVALSEELFASYTDMSDSELLQHNAMWLTVDSCPGYPCRVSLQDAQVGEQVLALSFTHHDVASPYKAAGPIFVRKQAKKRHVSRVRCLQCYAIDAYHYEAIPLMA
ncbi:hypothetical protein PULV_a1373 [Pseudoalteromonas ulvae UL12]|nr:hypothetical protein [Pseudoalteromonas ulvae UL12]